MGRSVAEQMEALGLVDDRTLGLRKAEKFLAEEEQRAKARKTVAVEPKDLENCGTVADFKERAKQFLGRHLNSTSIPDVVRTAHTFRTNNPEDPERRALIRFIYQLRDAWQNTPPALREKLLDRAFRKRNPRFDVSE